MTSPFAAPSRSLLPPVREGTARRAPRADWRPGPPTAGPCASVVLPDDSPVLAGVRRLHGQLSAGQLEEAREVLADQAPDQSALDPIRELSRAGVDLVTAERRLVSALRILQRPAGRSRLWVPIHDLDRQAAFAGEDEHAGAVRVVDGSVRTWLVVRHQPPG